MKYEVTKKECLSTEKGDTFTVRLNSRDPEFQHSILAVCGDDFQQIKIGDVIEMLISVVPKEVSSAE
jgi:hypothetical protein